MPKKKSDHLSAETKTVRASVGRGNPYNAVMPPITLSSTFEIDGLGHAPDYQYSRVRNPNRDGLAEAISDLEGGYGGIVTATGMASIALVLQLLKPGDLLLAPYDCYGRAYKLMESLAEKGAFDLEFIDQYDKKALQAAFDGKKPKMVFVESPSNPVMRVADITLISKYCRESKALLVCDNTFCSPVLQKPIALGADIVTQSTTKILNGHSDVVGGAVVTNSKKLWEELDFWANSIGMVGAPFDSYMTLRGMRTLHLRVERAQDNAMKVAKFLKKNEKVKDVFYPGLPNHPHHRITKKQQSGFGNVLSFDLDTNKTGLKRFVRNLQIFALAQSLGGVESLINHPATMTHVAMGPEAREKAGVTDGLLRLSVGIEDGKDLIRDLAQALDSV